MDKIKNLSLRKTIVLYMIVSLIISFFLSALIIRTAKYSLQGTTQGRYLTGGVPPVRFSM